MGDPPDPKYAWGAILYGDKGTLKLGVREGFDFYPINQKTPTITGVPLMEEDKFPEDRTEKDLERHVSSAIRRHWQNFLACRESRSKPLYRISSRGTSRRRELHSRQPEHEARPLSYVGSGHPYRRRR